MSQHKWKRYGRGCYWGLQHRSVGKFYLGILARERQDAWNQFEAFLKRVMGPNATATEIRRLRKDWKAIKVFIIPAHGSKLTADRSHRKGGAA